MKLIKNIYFLSLIALLFGCDDNMEYIPGTQGEVELTAIDAIIASDNDALTRADGDPTPTPTPVMYLEDHISRFKFLAHDRMTFTQIKRSSAPIPRFTYSDIAFENNASDAWDRDKTTGSDGVNGDAHPARIYWSDATSMHTFIGYSLPNVTGFDWEKQSGATTYIGSIGDPDVTTQINYHPSPAETDQITVKVDNAEVPKDIPISSLMRAEDLLLAYDTEVVADASVAHIKFYHGLSSIKVKVVLSEFYGSELDGYTIVEEMVLKNQPTLYKWTQDSYKAEARHTGTGTHSQNNPRDMFLWNYIPEGVGSNAGKTFTFYGITVPQETGYDFQDLVLSFKVRYPDPIKTDLAVLKTDPDYEIHWLDQTYTATIAKANPVFFHANQCTVINIKLNHRDEKITIGAQYTDWEFVPSPDEGELKKNSTFLQEAPDFDADENTRKVTIATDSKATEDDATWLYYQKNQDGTFVSGSDDGKVLLDIYGNTGTEAKPYTISTANQLLSLAYEISNGGHNFQGKYIKLDAGIVLQKNTESETVSWPGIGTSTNPFQGTFLGGGRKITLLKGAALFNYVGSNALIDNVTIEHALSLTGNAALAQNNAGVICACRVNGDVDCSGSGAVGSLVGTNSGTIFACHHTGFVKGSGTVCGLVGSNSGSILFSFHAGELEGATKYGIAPSGTITNCYYDNKLAPSVTAVSGVTNVTGKSTGDMQKEQFVTDINTQITTWLNGSGNSNPRHDHYATHSYQYQPATYPKIN